MIKDKDYHIKLCRLNRNEHEKKKFTKTESLEIDIAVFEWLLKARTKNISILYGTLIQQKL